MKLLSFSAISIALFSMACSDSGGGSDGTQGDPEMPSWETDLELTSEIQDIAPDLIKAACDDLVSVLEDADTRLACRVTSVGDSADAESCSAQLSDCEAEPGDALSRSSVRAAPAEIDCSGFTAEAIAGCEHKVSELVECINALSNSLVPSATAVSCDKAKDWSLEDADEEAIKKQGVQGYVVKCKPLEECEELVKVLLPE